VAEFAALGVTVEPDQVDEEEVLEIWDINADVFGAFLALETQWRVVALVGMESARIVRTGLDYAAVDVVLRRRGLDGAQPFDDIAVMEQASMAAFGEAAEA
jgi:hypothetical protein